jgi:hypothetical protein
MHTVSETVSRVTTLDCKIMRNMSHSATVLLFDEASTGACVRGEVEEAACGASQAGGGVPRAYNQASRQGTITVGECAWPPKYLEKDGVCAARFQWPVRRDSLPDSVPRTDL